MARDFFPRPEEASTGIGSIPSLLLSETAVDDEKDFINHWSDLRAHWHKTRNTPEGDGALKPRG